MRIAIAAAVAVVMSGCGGGGGDGGSGAPAADGPLSKYAGTYSYCDGHERGSVTATAAGNGQTVTFAIRSDIYASPNCAGAIVGTEVYSAPITAAYQSTASATVTGYPINGGPSQHTVDRVSITAPAGSISLTGSGVTMINGKQCVAYTNGHVCPESLSTAAISTTGGLAFTSNALLILAATAVGYELDSAYQR